MYAKATARVKYLIVKKVFDRVVTLALCYSAFFLSGHETEMVKHEAGVPLMDETLNMMIFADDLCYYQQVRRD